jgi:hypothetical protein
MNTGGAALIASRKEKPRRRSLLDYFLLSTWVVGYKLVLTVFAVAKWVGRIPQGPTFVKSAEAHRDRIRLPSSTETLRNGRESSKLAGL